MALMAKQVRRPSDPTVAASLDGGHTVAAPADGGYTTAVPNTRPTDKVELAWSTGDDLGSDDLGSDDLGAGDIPDQKRKATDNRQSWGATLRIASLLVAGCLVLAGAIVLGRWALTSEKPNTNAASQSSAKATASSRTSAAPASITSTPGQDKKFIQSLNDQGISFRDPDKAISSGKQICQDLLYKGVKRADEVEAFRAAQREDPGSAELANRSDDFVNASIKAYCPQYTP
jgi:hypothetical protein